MCFPELSLKFFKVRGIRSFFAVRRNKWSLTNDVRLGPVEAANACNRDFGQFRTMEEDGRIIFCPLFSLRLDLEPLPTHPSENRKQKIICLLSSIVRNCPKSRSHTYAIRVCVCVCARHRESSPLLSPSTCCSCCYGSESDITVEEILLLRATPPGLHLMCFLNDLMERRHYSASVLEKRAAGCRNERNDDDDDDRQLSNMYRLSLGVPPFRKPYDSGRKHPYTRRRRLKGRHFN